MTLKESMEQKRKGSLPTASGGHDTFSFDGVFREVNDKDVRQRLVQAQQKVKDGRWKDAEELLRAEISKLPDGHDKRNLKLILREINRYQEFKIDESVPRADSVDWQAVHARRPEMYFESFQDLPQSVFTIKTWTLSNMDAPDRQIVGRRLLSHQWIANKIRELHCSHVRASMLLGVLIDHRVQEDGVLVYYHPLTPSEKKFLLHDYVINRLNEVEISFPYPPLQGLTKTEIHCPDEGWEIDEELALQLGQGEVFLRDYSIEFLKTLTKEDLYLFDPACSTGQFLSTMKEAFPNSFTFGQDLSPCMASFAAHRLDEARCANAADPQIPDGTADVTFIRFINSEVLKAKDARGILNSLLRPLKVGGHMVIFGHTPVLIGAADLLMRNDVSISRCVGGDIKYDGIFQYYILTKTM